MKYLAILRDSYREAIDSKVIYVLVAMSLLLTLFVLTVSVKPQTAEKTMSEVVEGKFLDFVGHMGHARKRRSQTIAVEINAKKFERIEESKHFRFQKVEVASGTEDSPDSEYKVTVGLHVRGKKLAERARKSPASFVSELRENCSSAEEYELLKIKSIVPVAANPPQGQNEGKEAEYTAYFEVITAPTGRTRQVWEHQFSIFFGAVPIGGAAPLGMVLLYTVNIVLWIGSLVAILGSVIITAFFIPNMLRKGTVDLLLVKPIHRPALLVYKYVGGLTFIFLTTTIAILGIWLALGLRTGVWANAFLLMIFVYTFFFAILYAVSTLFAVLTRSAVVAILVTIGAWFLFFVSGLLHGFYEVQHKNEERAGVAEADRSTANAFWTVVRVIHFVLPRTSDVNDLGNMALVNDFIPSNLARDIGMERTMISWGESLSVSGAFIAVMLGLSCWRFATKDY